MYRDESKAERKMRPDARHAPPAHYNPTPKFGLRECWWRWVDRFAGVPWSEIAAGMITADKIVGGNVYLGDLTTGPLKPLGELYSMVLEDEANGDDSMEAVGRFVAFLDAGLAAPIDPPAGAVVLEFHDQVAAEEAFRRMLEE